MKRVLTVLFFSAFLCLLKARAVEKIPLPGEEGERAALVCDSFPSRLHAFVWRNWSVVPVDRLAQVLETTPAKVSQIAVSMGLSAQQKTLPEWKNEGYITVLRRNWHLLPYPQLLTLMDFSREKMREHLIENDFLFIKLGSVKPKCAPLVYHEPTEIERERAQQIAALLKKEGVSPADTGEPRFAFIPVLSKPLPAAAGAIKKDESSFDLRLIFSYFADFADPLYDPEVPSYPDGLLQRLSDNGVNAVWLHTVLRTLAPPTEEFPEFGKDYQRRISGLKVLVQRARKYDIDVYLYVNEPRAMPQEFFDVAGRETLKGISRGGLHTMCTSIPAVRQWISDSLAYVFQEVEGLGGVFTITASENLTSCASHRLTAGCERCKNRDYADIIAEVNTTIAEGVRRGNPKARTVVWDWGWDDKYAPDIIAKLPETCWFMSVSEWSLPIERGGVKSNVGEYSISSPGPGPRASKHWQLAKEHGLKTVAKVQAGLTWEFCVIPYLPVMDLVAEHAHNLSDSNVDGVMLSWSLGCYPSPNLRIFQAMKGKDESVDGVLDAMADSLYGRQGRALARQAWTAFSNGFREYPYHISSLYVGPQHMGPANPLYLNATGYSATMVGIPYDSLNAWRSIYPFEVWVQQLERVRHGFEQGCALYEKLAEAVDANLRAQVQRELGTYRAATLHFESMINQARFIDARDKLAADDQSREKYIQTMRNSAKAELDVAKRMLPLVQSDSRIGYESSNHYFYIPQDLLEKIVNCHYVLSQLK
ncbi:MAG: hypothetical protein PHO37_16800 [Kiritimatiellae bacterium]|nr:hypothetical protein [Kiritimatiellia bacterium]